MEIYVYTTDKQMPFYYCIHFVYFIMLNYSSFIYLTPFSIQPLSPGSGTYDIEHTLLRQPFQWQPQPHDVVIDTTNITVCRNSVQGRRFIVDERGIQTQLFLFVS